MTMENVPTNLPEVEFVSRPKPPNFRFCAELRGISVKRLRVFPHGYTDFILDHVDDDARLAVGEIHTLDGEKAVVCFANGSGRDRELARQALLGWAEQDDWVLRFAAELIPMTLDDLAETKHWNVGICTTCGEPTGTGFASHMGWSQKGWQGTRCFQCKVGRMRWHTPDGEPLWEGD